MNYKRSLPGFPACLLTLLLSSLAFADGGYIRTAVPMDEPRGYCLDVAGFGVDARPDEALRVHTCKYGEDNIDQLFKWVDDETDHVAIPAYNRCLAAESAASGANILVSECADSDLQAWTFVPNGNLALRDHPKLCLTAGDDRRDAGSDILVFPGYQYRSSTMQACRERGDELQDFRWGRDDENERGLANALRSGMATEIQQGIRSIYESGSGNVKSRTDELYVDVARTYRPTEVETTAEIAYGDHDRQQLDVHVDTNRRGSDLAPVVVFFHGGGYVRGNKEDSRNVAEHFASIGLVGVTATYRLAPEAKWPDGANDIAAAVQWISDNISEYGGDPENIFVVGKSAGGGHVANYAFRPDVLNGEYAEAAGIVLISGNYDASTEAYFGTNQGGMEEKQIFGNVSRASIPVMLTSSQYDLGATATATLRLANELASDHGAVPRIRQLAGHNHYSPNISIGTSDRMLSDAILDFVLDTAH
jgi:acetyl esterase/lipase